MPSIQGIMAAVNHSGPLNIITIGCAHERYEQTLALTGHNFYSLKYQKAWNNEYGIRPKNYFELNSLPDIFDYHLILSHVSDERIYIAKELSEMLGVPVIRHTHTLPFSEVEKDLFKSIQVDLDTFISAYSASEWGSTNPATVINHGLDIGFWNDGGRSYENSDNTCLSVVNFWKDRDSACGWHFWNEATHDIPKVVCGNNPGLSEPKQPHQLKKMYYNSRIFINTSLRSPIPMSLLEAMACGCAVISTNTCMIPEIIENGYNGFLCDSPEEMNRQCKLLLSQPELANIIGKRAAETIRSHFNHENFIRSWDNIFRGIIS